MNLIVKPPSTSLQQITRLKAGLASVDDAFIMRCIRALVKGGFRTPPQIAGEDFEREYLLSLRGVCAGSLERVIVKLKSGKLDVVRKEFLPIPAALASFCHEERIAMAEEIRKLREGDPRRAAIWNQLPDSMNNRQREEEIDRRLMALETGR